MVSVRFKNEEIFFGNMYEYFDSSAHIHARDFQNIQYKLVLLAKVAGSNEVCGQFKTTADAHCLYHTYA